MKVIRNIKDLQPYIEQGCVLTIGNFDGVHRGHQAILKRLKEIAKLHKIPNIVMTFEPSAQEYFQGDNALPRLSNFREKCCLLEEEQIDIWLILRFSSLVLLSAQEFIEKILLQINVKYLIVGDDFRFGHNRTGDFHLLVETGKQYHFTVQDTATIYIDNQRISSTYIRTLLQNFNFAKATQLLGRDYCIMGRVIHGEKRGRQLGFPTANIALNRKKCALKGVFIVKISGLDKVYYGVGNIGSRPTVNGHKERLEVHLFDFSGDLYGKYVMIDFLHFLRGEKRFTSLDELKLAINTDVTNAKQWLNSKGLTSGRL